MSRRLSMFLAAGVVLPTAAKAADAPVLVRAPVEKVFVPKGFDDNDDVELVIYGHFTNTCYRTGPVSTSVDEGTGTITIDAQSYFYGGLCGQIVFPYSQTVKLGILKAGTYKITVRDTPQADTHTALAVVPAQSANPDDFLYATVDSADFTKDAAGVEQVHLEGSWPYTLYGCMTMKEVRTELADGNVMVVRPIAQIVNVPDSDPLCSAQQATHKFQIDTPLTNSLAAGTYLLHVRVLNGNSVNRVEQVIGDK